MNKSRCIYTSVNFHLVRFKFIKYLIPFIFLGLGIKGILHSTESQQAGYSKVTKFKLPSRSTHSDSPDSVDDFVANNHVNSEESDDNEDEDYYTSWFSKTSKDAHHVYINHISENYVFSHQLILNYLPKIYLKIRVLRL